MNTKKSNKSALDKVKGARQKGNGYEIRFYHGKDYTEMWYPDPEKSDSENAEELQHQVLLFRKKCRGGDMVVKDLKFQEIAEKMLTTKALSLSEGTIERYRGCAVRVYAEFGHLKLKEIKTYKIQDFIDRLLTEPRAKTIPKAFKAEQTKKKKRKSDASKSKAKSLTPLSRDSASLHLNFMSNVYQYAISKGMVESNFINPCTTKSITLPKKTRNKKIIYTNDEIEGILDGLEKEATADNAEWRHIFLYYFILLAFYTGARTGELLGLDWSNIDWAHGVIEIEKQAKNKKGQGSVDSETKTVESVRYISLPEELFTMLREYKVYQEKQRQKLVEYGLWTDSGKIFTAETGKPICTTQPYDWFNCFCKRNNFRFVSPHGCRHANASYLIFAGIDLITLAHVLGHTDSTTTQKEYGHWIKQAQARTKEAIGNALPFRRVQKTQGKQDKDAG